MLARRLDRQLTRLVRARSFAIYAVMGYTVIDPTATFLVVPLAVFLVPAVIVQHIQAGRLQRLSLAVEFYRNAVARMENRWFGRGDSGTRYLDSNTLFADDLDLFGRGSLFQYLCTARTTVGQDTLAHWLQHSSETAEICERQAAVQELSERLDVRELLATVDLGRDTLRSEALVEWGNAADPLRGSIARYSGRYSGIAVVAIAVALWSWSGYGPWLTLALVLLEAGLWLVLQRRLRVVTGPAVEALQIHAELDVLRKSMRSISFHAPRLAQIRSRIGSQPTRSAFIDAILGFVARRPLLWMLARQVTSHVDQWRRGVAFTSLQRLQAWGELEALASLAQYRYEQPETTFPEIISAQPCYEATRIGHPLIPAARRVANDLMLGDSPRLLIISGSNMCGKSTMLRTVGVNAVLALCGAPVCAARLRLSPLRIGTAMRFQDSLQQQTSHFRAVIERLRRIMVLPVEDRPLLFLIDEILQGTNSRDRLAGAQALAKSFVNRNSLGLITTHDLELTRMVDSLGGRAVNVHFVDQWVDGELQFDYVMRPGVVQSSNAIDLMRRMGLEV